MEFRLVGRDGGSDAGGPDHFLLLGVLEGLESQESMDTPQKNSSTALQLGVVKGFWQGTAVRWKHFP